MAHRWTLRGEQTRGADNVDKSSGTRAKTKKRYPGGTGTTHEDTTRDLWREISCGRNETLGKGWQDMRVVRVTRKRRGRKEDGQRRAMFRKKVSGRSNDVAYDECCRNRREL